MRHSMYKLRPRVFTLSSLNRATRSLPSSSLPRLTQPAPSFYFLNHIVYQQYHHIGRKATMGSTQDTTTGKPVFFL